VSPNLDNQPPEVTGVSEVSDLYLLIFTVNTVKVSYMCMRTLTHTCVHVS